MNDSDLSALLKNWKAPAVPGDFDQNVWRRIRLRQPEPVRPWWQAWIYSPLRLGTVAALLAVTLGGWAGSRISRPPAPSFAFSGGETVTGAYLQFAKGPPP